MNKSETRNLLIGAGIGFGLTYALDPAGGRRRRTAVAEKFSHFFRRIARAAETSLKDAKNRSQGIFYSGKNKIARRNVPDNLLLERVRSQLGHLVQNPASIGVTVSDGQVVLAGPILAREVRKVVGKISSLTGVHCVEEHFEVHDTAENVPGLQGEAAAEDLSVGKAAWRWLAGLAGAGMVGYGLRRKDWAGSGLTAAGMGLLAQSAVDLDWSRLTGIGAGRSAVDLQKTVDIDAPVEEVFGFWSNYDNFPQFMSHVKEVRKAGADGRQSHWVVEGPAGIPVEWDAVLTKYVPNQLMAWKTVDGSKIRHSGMVRFTRMGEKTQVNIRLTYNPVAGAIGHAVASILGANPKRELDDDMARIKAYFETGHPARDSQQPVGLS